jgi:hypothetical protein
MHWLSEEHGYGWDIEVSFVIRDIVFSIYTICIPLPITANLRSKEKVPSSTPELYVKKRAEITICGEPLEKVD